MLDARCLSAYKGQLVIKAPFARNSGSFGRIMILGIKNSSRPEGIQTIRHEWGHYVQYQMLGTLKYYLKIGIPSFKNTFRKLTHSEYFSQPWEITADIFGGVDWTVPYPGFTYMPEAEMQGVEYLEKIMRNRV